MELERPLGKLLLDMNEQANFYLTVWVTRDMVTVSFVKAK